MFNGGIEFPFILYKHFPLPKCTFNICPLLTFQCLGIGGHLNIIIVCHKMEKESGQYNSADEYKITGNNLAIIDIYLQRPCMETNLKSASALKRM